MPDPREVRSMFARIAGRYDFLNHTLSMGIDTRWRRSLFRACGDVRGRVAVDVCCGTGDVALGLARRGASVVALDFTPEMLARASHKSARLRGSTGAALFVHGDALQLAVRDACADLATIAFGIRNVQDRAAALSEVRRVLRPGGRLCVLEFSLPRGKLLSSVYRSYFQSVLPRIGGLVSRDRGAYDYLPRTVMAWPAPAEFQREIEAQGFVGAGYELLSGGIACLHWGHAGSTSST